MYQAILLLLDLLILIASVTCLLRYRDVPSSRRMSAGLGVSGLLLAPAAASFLYDLLISVLSIGLVLLIFLGGIGMILRSIIK